MTDYLHTCFASDSRQVISMQAVTLMVYLESGTSSLTSDEFNKTGMRPLEEDVLLLNVILLSPSRFTE